jgi:hypothetical protein
VEKSLQISMVELQRRHKEELNDLRRDKEQLLKDETRATQAGANPRYASELRHTTKTKTVL